MMDEHVMPPRAPFDATVTPPGSKSLTNRALVLATLADGTSTLTNVLLADDTAVMLDGLAKLGFELAADGTRVEVVGRAGEVPAKHADLFVGNSGTTVRFLAALCALGRGTFRLDGVPRMRERPIGPLVDLLNNLGGRARYENQPGFPPVRVTANTLPGGRAFFGGALSSQYLSAVLHVAPCASRHEVRVDLGDVPSWPYVEMSMRLMDVFGVTPELERDPDTGRPTRVVVPQWRYAATEYDVEPDASAATYFLGLAALHEGSRVVVRGLGKDSLQGDARFGDVLRAMGVEVSVARDSITAVGPRSLAPFDFDFGAMPDTAQTAAALALFADGPSTLRGLRTLRVKETDRVAALAAELAKFGARVEVDGDDLTVTPSHAPSPCRVATYDDHRMAMSFALAATRVPGTVIADAGCVAKTYPRFFDDLRAALGNA